MPRGCTCFTVLTPGFPTLTDVWHRHGHRPKDYNQTDYFNEFGIMVNAINNDASIPTRGNLVAPSLQGTWTLQSVFDIGFVTSYNSSISILSVEQYPDNNCAAAFPDAGFGTPVNPQDVFPNYLAHSAGRNLIAQYLPAIPTAQQAGKQFMMFETNTASCGGFPGVSDSFGSALWAVDYGLQMAYSNFTGALLHIGGQDVSYNVSVPSYVRASADRGPCMCLFVALHPAPNEHLDDARMDRRPDHVLDARARRGARHDEHVAGARPLREQQRRPDARVRHLRERRARAHGARQLHDRAGWPGRVHSHDLRGRRPDGRGQRHARQCQGQVPPSTVRCGEG